MIQTTQDNFEFYNEKRANYSLKGRYDFKMKKDHQPYKLSYESDGKMDDKKKDEKKKNKSANFFNITPDSE